MQIYYTGRNYYSHNYYEQDKEYKKCKYISIFILFVIVTAVWFMHLVLNINFTNFVSIPKAQFSLPYEKIENAEKNINKEKSRKIFADYSDFIIFQDIPVQKKEEEKKKEEPVKKVVTKKAVVKKEVMQEKKAVNISTVKTDNPSAVIGSSTSNAVNAKQEAAARIVNQMERYKKYPKQARRVGAEGISKVTFSLDTNGVVAGIRLSLTSGNKILDNAALKAAEKIIGYKAVVDNSYGKLLEVTVPVDFYLN
ncbi:MAG: TonB family protein [Mucispirillum sp.]|nr:TonB family protein [Mucispirillum sp.]